MKYIYVIITISLFFSCASQKNNKKIKYKGIDVKTQSSYVYSILIPKGFKEENIKRSLESDERQFLYSDSSIFYITNEVGTPVINYDNIDNDSIAIQKSFMALIKNDTLTLNGKDSMGRYWKNIKTIDVNIGYLNVPIERKEEFEKALSTIRKK